MSAARVSQSAFEVLVLPNPHALVFQSAFEAIVPANPFALVSQSALELIVIPAPLPPPLSAACNNPPGGFLGVPYSHTFGASGGTPPYTFAITAGSLPFGLTLDGATGIASGIPTAAAAFPFTIQVTDSAASTASVNCSITIAAAIPLINVQIIFRGVKRYPLQACEDQGQLLEAPEAPHVKKAV